MDDEQVLDPTLAADEDVFDRTLRPRALADYVGQQKVRDNLDILLEAANFEGISVRATSRGTTAMHRA